MRHDKDAPLEKFHGAEVLVAWIPGAFSGRGVSRFTFGLITKFHYQGGIFSSY